MPTFSPSREAQALSGDHRVVAERECRFDVGVFGDGADHLPGAIARATAGNVEARPPGALDQPFNDGGEVLHTPAARKPPQISDSPSAGVRVRSPRLPRGRHRGNLLRARHSTDDSPVLKTGRPGLRVPWVRIPPPPLPWALPRIVGCRSDRTTAKRRNVSPGLVAVDTM
jgi:hypothetical protein